MEETFTYDDMNRLTGITLKRPSGQDLHCAMTYDALGRMTSKQAVTSVNGTPQVTTTFSLPSFNATKVHAMTQAQTSAGLFSSSAQTLTYTGFDKVSTLRQGNDRILFTYGYDHQRIGMQKLTPETSQAKDYVGSCEFITRSVMGGTDTKSLTYLTGPYGVFAVVESHNGTDALHYILKDNLGSWVTITDANGTAEQQMSFDAWGNRRDPQTWANYTASDVLEEPMFDRGFTGHEHLYSFGLVNMNGRIYDPVMSSFLSPDRYVQNPWSAQGFNRYAYCMYNPLRFVDPTGWLAGGGHGSSPDDPPPYVNFEGWTSGYLLNEVTVIPDNPSLSNTMPIDEVWYTPNMSGGGRTPHWSNVDNGQSNGSGGAGGGGSHGGMYLSANHQLSFDLSLFLSSGSTILGYKQQLWGNPKSRAQKEIIQEKAYEIQKTLKSQGITKHTKDIKAGKISKLRSANKGFAVLGLSLEAYDVINNKEIKTSNIVNTGVTIASIWCWPIGGIYLVTDLGSFLFTGRPIGDHIDDWVGEPIYDFNKP